MEAWNGKGISLYNLGKYNDALAAYNEALKHDREYKFAWSNKGLALQILGKNKEALQAFDEAIKLDSKDSIVWNHKGNSLFNLGKYEDALTAYEEAIKNDPKQKYAWFNKGDILCCLGKYEWAVQAFDEAINLDWNYTNAWNGKGEALENSGKFEDAFLAYKEVVKIDADYYANSKKKKPKVLEKFERSCFSKDIDYSAKPLFKDNDLLDDSHIKAQYIENELRLIGQGSYGKVYLAIKKEGGEKVAVKVIETSNEEDMNDSVNELLNLNKIKGHPNILTCLNYRLKSVIKNNAIIHQIFIEMPLATNSLQNMIEKNEAFSEEQIINILGQVSLAIKFAHSQNMAHLDIKPDNILFVGNTCKLADWGGSLQLSNSQSTTVKYGFGRTRDWIAPELEDGSYGTKQDKYNYFQCDIYTIALVALRLCGVPYQKIKSIPKADKECHDSILQKIIKDIKGKFSSKLLEVLENMTAFEPKKRISIDKVLEFTDSFQKSGKTKKFWLF